MSEDESHGCIIKEGEDKCCWTNSNSCSFPINGQLIACPEVITYCCKTKYFDEEIRTYKYEYSKWIFLTK